MCAYSLEDIKKVMAGPFKELKKNCENWNNPETIPSPRPGQVHCRSDSLSEPIHTRSPGRW